MELTFLFERVVDTLGMIAPLLDLAKNRSATEKMRYLRAITDLAFRGQRALKAFGQRWAYVQEENRNHPPMTGVEDFADIFQEAKQVSIPELPPSSDTANGEEDHHLYEAPGICTPPNSGSVIVEVAYDCQAVQQLPSQKPPSISDQARAEAASEPS